MSRTWQGRAATARPTEEAATTLPFAEQPTDVPAETTAAELRRRRYAGRRLEPLDDGTVDPQGRPFDRDRFTSVRLLHVEIGRRTAWLYGGRCKQLIDRVGTPSQWDHRLRLWMIPVDRADDLLAYAEHAEGRFTTVEAVDR